MYIYIRSRCRTLHGLESERCILQGNNPKFGSEAPQRNEYYGMKK